MPPTPLSRDLPAFATGPSRSLAVNLRRVWDVQADSTYNIRCNRPERNLVTVRTLKGEGELHLEGRHPVVVKDHSVVTIEQPRLRHYRCRGHHWDFWWFEFTTTDPLPCALATPFTVPGHSSDAHAFAEIFTKLQHPAFAERSIASASFALLMLRWAAETRRQRGSPHRELIETIIDHIHADLAANWSVPGLAADAGICETLFRREFKKATGMPPATFIRQARLHAAAQMLEQGTRTLAGIAEQLHFSSPFHLSAAFKKQFGVSPSQLRSPGSPR